MQLPPADENPSDVDNVIPPASDPDPVPPDEPVPAVIDPATREIVPPPPSRPNPSDAPQFAENAPVLTEDVWVCVEPEGPRTATGGVVHPPFVSSAHRHGHMVECPVCGSTSARRATAAEAGELVV